MATVLGLQLDWLTIHKASFLVFAVVVGVHALARLVPAFNLGTGRSRREGGVGRLGGWGPRLAIVTATLVAGALAARADPARPPRAGRTSATSTASRPARGLPRLSPGAQ